MESLNVVIFSLLLLLASIFMETEARPFNIIKASKCDGVALGGFFDGLESLKLSLGSIKQAGPSPGEGHKFINSHTFGGIKDAGPSPGEGHRFADANTFGGVKDAGPSPGGGHGFTDAKTHDEMKDSGPSPGKTKGTGPSSGAGH